MKDYFCIKHDIVENVFSARNVFIWTDHNLATK